MTSAEQKFRITEIIAKSFHEDLDVQEQQELDRWLAESTHHKELLATWMAEETLSEKAAAWQRLKVEPVWQEFRRIRRQKQQLHRRRLFRQYAKQAAVFMLPLVLGIWLWVRNQPDEYTGVGQQVETTIKSGQSQAVLTLSTGERVALDVTEQKIEEPGAVIRTDSGKLSYQKLAGTMAGKEEVFNTIQVPRGGEYFVVLADGTKVWLNAATQLKFPVEFQGNSRKVYLEGEAYFQVTSDKQHPFIVVTEKASVKVYGTAFNVCFYREDQVMLTTLEEGCVEVESAGQGEKIRMAPGEQVRLDAKGQMTKKEVNTALYTSWRAGRLVFEKMNLGDLLHNLSRWYDVEIVFRKESLKNIVFTGDLKKYDDLDEVFEVIELASDARFKVEGRKIIVY